MNDVPLRNQAQRKAKSAGGHPRLYKGLSTAWATLQVAGRVRLAVHPDTFKGACRFTTLKNVKPNRDMDEVKATLERKKNEANVLTMLEGATNEPRLTRIEAELVSERRE